MSISAKTLRRFPNSAFVETGSYSGDGIQAALDAGFKRIESIEISQTIATPLIDRFHDEPVKICVGDSGKLLGPVLDRHTEPCTIWLDAHGQWADDSDWIFPLEAELQSITKPHHTILIDDLRLMGREFPITLDEVRALALKVNPNYRFSYAPGHCPKDILICQP